MITNENLIKHQMKVIDELQEKIKLLEFDITKLNRENTDLKFKLNYRGRTAVKARDELVNMKRMNDYSNINTVLAILRSSNNEE